MAFFRLNIHDASYLFLIHFDIVVQIKIALLFIIVLMLSFMAKYKYLYNTLLCIFACFFIYSTKQNFLDTYNLIKYNDTKKYISLYKNYPEELIKKRYLLEYICLETIKQKRPIVSSDTMELRPCDVYSYNYIHTIYNNNYAFFKDSNINSIDKLYNKFLNTVGKPISKEELEKHNFNDLLKRYKKQ